MIAGLIGLLAVVMTFCHFVDAYRGHAPAAGLLCFWFIVAWSF